MKNEKANQHLASMLMDSWKKDANQVFNAIIYLFWI